MTGIIDSRKRSREEDGSDFMPLSKRITNLNINISSSPMQGDNDIMDYNMNINEQQQTDQMNSLQFYNHNQLANTQPSAELNHFNEFSSAVHPDRQIQYQPYLNEYNNANISNSSSCTKASFENYIHMEPYAPELSQEQNPYYYDQNKLLYDLYVERLRRHH